jgi:hypothetical protein
MLMFFLSPKYKYSPQHFSDTSSSVVWAYNFAKRLTDQECHSFLGYIAV